MGKERKGVHGAWWTDELNKSVKEKRRNHNKMLQRNKMKEAKG